MPRVTVYLTDDLAEFLQRKKNNGTSKSSVIKKALRDYMGTDKAGIEMQMQEVKEQEQKLAEVKESLKERYEAAKEREQRLEEAKKKIRDRNVIP